MNIVVDVQGATGVTQTLDPAVENEFGAHVVQDVAPADEYVPAPHTLHAVEPAPAYRPAAHGTHDVLVTGKYQPPAQPIATMMTSPLPPDNGGLKLDPELWTPADPFPTLL